MKYLLLLLLAPTARAAPLVLPQDIANPSWSVFVASQDSTNSSRLQFDSSWFVFAATTQYRFDYYGVMASSSSNLFANINCVTNGSKETP